MSNQTSSIYTYKFPTEKLPNCMICNPKANQKTKISLPKDKNFDQILLSDLIEEIEDKFRFKNFSIANNHGFIVFSTKKKRKNNDNDDDEEDLTEQSLATIFKLEKDQKTETFEIILHSPSLINSVQVQIELK